MANFLDSVFSHFEQRLKTQFYSIFAFWWIVLHGQFFYAALFDDADKIYAKTGLLKSEYLQQKFANYHDPKFWLLQAFLVLIAALLTYLMIWIVPRYLLLPAYRAERQHEFDKRKIRLEYDRESEKLATAREEQAAKTRQATEKRVKAEAGIVEANPEVLWEEEYAELSQLENHGLYMDDLIKCLYRYSGEASVPGTYRISQEALAYADANGLITFNSDNRKLAVTDKGRFFIRKYQAE